MISNFLKLLVTPILTLTFSVASAAPVSDLPPAAIVHQLVADGHDVRGIKCKPGVCSAAIRDSFGVVNQHAVNAETGKAVKNGITSRFVHMPGPREVSAMDAMLAVAQVGHFNLISIEYRGGNYNVLAKDDAGEVGRFKVNAATKSVVEIEK
ncbi:hypothetical protein [Paramagnetospirillum marisnigri]|jgi:hypothetical protein|uniref:hypothetical protein n=1 Tax=Paramagnetospirillum marisnigri TaxID=1285242 RepID=UPI0012E815C0|nr:hypothetical protein [Paramagnetospirillum marisnigri]